jgi:hypothetical protein
MTGMSADDFVAGIRMAVYRAAVDGVLRQLTKPVGRKPRADLAELSAWFNQLGTHDKDRVAAVAERAAYQAVFGMMAVLDGVRTIDDDYSDLYLRTGDGTLLNEEHDLHELFQIGVDHELGHVDEFGRPPLV